MPPGKKCGTGFSLWCLRGFSAVPEGCATKLLEGEKFGLAALSFQYRQSAEQSDQGANCEQHSIPKGIRVRESVRAEKVAAHHQPQHDSRPDRKQKAKYSGNR